MSQSRGIVFLAAIVWWWAGGWPFSSPPLGGKEADIADLPYMASIQWHESGSNDCSAVIISSEWLLTHYRCKSILKPTGFYAHVGSSKAERVSTHQVVEWIKQPSEQKAFHFDEFSLVKVKPPFKFGAKVAAAKLPALYQDTPSGAAGVVAGWGEVKNGYQLRSGNVNLISDAKCKDVQMLRDSENYICAKVAKDEIQLCLRDYGGPLVVDGTVFGIAVEMEDCTSFRDMQKFAKVSSARNWIYYTTGV